MSDPLVRTAQGAVRGRASDGVSTFLGIPFAAPPFGANRLLAPRPATRWVGVRDALDFGPKAPQPPYPPPIAMMLPELVSSGEDCLTFMYEFAWRSPQYGGALGACHTLEIPFVFDTLGQGTEPLWGPDPPQSLADEMHKAWVAFARNGDPAGRTTHWTAGRRCGLGCHPSWSTTPERSSGRCGVFADDEARGTARVTRGTAYP